MLSSLEKKRKVYAGHRPCALRKGPLTSKLARAPPEKLFGSYKGRAFEEQPHLLYNKGYADV
eukprot:1146135-Pelagomonas_calceolata.AAC.5